MTKNALLNKDIVTALIPAEKCFWGPPKIYKSESGEFYVLTRSGEAKFTALNLKNFCIWLPPNDLEKAVCGLEYIGTLNQILAEIKTE